MIRTDSGLYLRVRRLSAQKLTSRVFGDRRTVVCYKASKTETSSNYAGVVGLAAGVIFPDAYALGDFDDGSPSPFDSWKSAGRRRHYKSSRNDGEKRHTKRRTILDVSPSILRLVFHGDFRPPPGPDRGNRTIGSTAAVARLPNPLSG